MILSHDFLNKVRTSWTLGQVTYHTVQTGTYLTRAFADGKTELNLPEIRAEVRRWGQKLCKAFDVRVNVRGQELDESPGIIVCNHVSYIDVPAILSLDAVSFVAKAEVRRMPVLGPAAEAFGVIFVDRESEASRKGTSNTLRDAVKEKGRRVVVFPEGTTSLRGLPWRPGVFKLAQENGLRMQAMSICYRPAGLLAFEMDSMFEHVMQVRSDGPIEAMITIGPSFHVTDFLKDAATWQDWNQQMIAQELAAQGV